MGRFVQLIVAGGLALGAMLWLVALSDGGSVFWAVGVVLSLAALGSVVVGIWMELEV